MNKEIKRLEYWIRNIVGMITADKAFSRFSERGIKPDFSKILNPKRFHQLQNAKITEGWHVDMYEQGVIEGSVPYWTLLGGEDYREIPLAFFQYTPVATSTRTLTATADGMTATLKLEGQLK